ncbi:MAG: M3 family metallopeptidase [Bacteroidales bacterium]|nr:M3 family metallopeptidase [Bacteroidales bacterium]
MNVLLQDWEYPPFDKIKTEDYEPAVMEAISEAEHNIEMIATNSEAPTFENTVEALETASRRLDRISAVMMNLNECCTNDELQAVVMRLEPLMTRFSMKVMTDERLYRRVLEVERGGMRDEKGERKKEEVERRTLMENTLKGFRRHGVALPEEEREEFKRNAEELSELQVRFGQNALGDLNDWTLHLCDEADLEGLPQAVRDAAREEAQTRGLEGWVFTLSAPSYVPFMTYSARRDLRERMYRAYGSVGGRGNERDNNGVIRRIVELRAEQARLLGYDTYCDYVLEDRMVQSLPNLQRFMQELKAAVLPAALREREEVRGESYELRVKSYELRGKREEGRGEELMPWDFSFYSEQLKQQRYDLDSEALRPYFPLEAVREGIFGLYGKLYGLHFEPAPDIPVYHEDVRVYRVSRLGVGDGTAAAMGILYLDMHPRPSKRSGAWMTEFRGQYGKVRPQIQVVCNFSKPTADTPALLRFSEVETFMHEMGHAMHGMLSEVEYESLSGTNVKRDFVEMPSQVMENWCYEPEFLATFARHYQTGEALPTEYVEKIRAAQNHMAGWLCLRQLNLGMTDIAFHTMGVENGEWKAEEVEAKAMENLLPRVAGCCTATNFSHIFGGGYASGYYGYKWAEVLDADIFSRFKHDGIFNAETAEAFRREVLSRGGTEHPAVLFRNFMGRDPDNKALLKRMNLI